MSAEVLREAARLMRERAEAADVAPWRQDSQIPGDTVIFNAEGEWVTNVASGRTVADNVVTFDHEVANGEHIASWHPAVALAVADWLDGQASQDELLRRHGAAGMTEVSPAVIVARAYLGVEVPA